MAAPVYKTYSMTGAQAPWNSDLGLDYFQTTAAVWISNPGTVYGLEYTFDDVADAAVTPRWFPDAGLPPGTNVSGTSLIYHQFRWLRVNITVLVGTLELKIIQGMRQR